MALAMSASANARFKAHYQRYVRRALVGALILHVAAFVFSPPISFKPYKLREEQFEVIEVAENIELPPPPKEIEMPKMAVEIAEGDEGEETDEVPETSFDDFSDLPPPPPPGGGDAGGVFLAFDEPPVLVHFEVPKYPDLAREAGIEGTVRVKVLVAEDGKVIDASVISSDVTAAMEASAVAAALKCRFKPAKQRTQPVKAHVMVPFIFRLR